MVLIIFSDQELPYTMATNFDDLIFDEFHIFSMPQIVAAITAMLFFLEYMQDNAPRFLFSSATPDPTFLQMMNRAGIRFHEVRGVYSSTSGEDLRHILHPSSLTLLSRTYFYRRQHFRHMPNAGEFCKRLM
jgi:CRISPR-associated endonuclease/helicase Cas3